MQVTSTVVLYIELHCNKSSNSSLAPSELWKLFGNFGNRILFTTLKHFMHSICQSCLTKNQIAKSYWVLVEKINMLSISTLVTVRERFKITNFWKVTAFLKEDISYSGRSFLKSLKSLKYENGCNFLNNWYFDTKFEPKIFFHYIILIR